MSCDEVQARLALALTEPGAPEPPADVAAHLTACSACKARADELRAVVGVVRSVAGPGGDVTPRPFESVLARVHSPARRSRRLLARAAALLLAALAGAAADRAWVRSPGPAATPPELREFAGRPGGLGASMAVLAGLERRK